MTVWDVIWMCVLKRLQPDVFFTLVIPSHICKPLYVTVSMEEWQYFVYFISFLQIEGETHVTCCSFAHLKNNMLRCTFSSKKKPSCCGCLWSWGPSGTNVFSVTCFISSSHSERLIVEDVTLSGDFSSDIHVCVCVCVCVCVRER